MLWDEDAPVLAVLHSVFESTQGILNALVYGMNDNVRFYWKRYLILNGYCLCLFPDAQNFKESVEYYGRMSLASSDSEAESRGSGRNSSRDIEMELRKAIEEQNNR